MQITRQRIVAVIATAWLAVSPAAAQEPPKKPGGPTPVIDGKSGAISGVIDPGDPNGQLKATTAKSKQLYDAIHADHPAFADLATSTRAYIDRPNDPKAASQYAEHFVSALEVVKGRLDEFRAMKDQVQQSFDQQAARTKTDLKATQQKLEDVSKNVKESRAKTVQLDTELDEIVKQHGSLLEAGQELPPKAAQAFAELESEIAFQRQQAAIMDGKKGKIAVRIKALEHSLATNQFAAWKYRMAFNQADRDVKLLDLTANGLSDALVGAPTTIGPADLPVAHGLPAWLFENTGPEPEPEFKAPVYGSTERARQRYERLRNAENQAAAKPDK